MGVICTMPKKRDLFWCLPLFLGRGVFYFSALLSLSKVGTLSSPSKNLDRPDQMGPDQTGQDFDALTALKLKFGRTFRANFSRYFGAEVWRFEAAF